MDSLLQQAFLILEQRSVASVDDAQQTYKQCCHELGLSPTPLMFPNTEAEEPP